MSRLIFNVVMFIHLCVFLHFHVVSRDHKHLREVVAVTNDTFSSQWLMMLLVSLMAVIMSQSAYSVGVKMASQALVA